MKKLLSILLILSTANVVCLDAAKPQATIAKFDPRFAKCKETLKPFELFPFCPKGASSDWIIYNKQADVVAEIRPTLEALEDYTTQESYCQEALKAGFTVDRKKLICFKDGVSYKLNLETFEWEVVSKTPLQAEKIQKTSAQDSALEETFKVSEAAGYHVDRATKTCFIDQNGYRWFYRLNLETFEWKQTYTIALSGTQPPTTQTDDATKTDGAHVIQLDCGCVCHTGKQDPAWSYLCRNLLKHARHVSRLSTPTKPDSPARTYTGPWRAIAGKLVLAK